jgi:hypothetical protein
MEITGILKVKDPGYIPEGVTIRTKIVADIYTVSLEEDLVETVRQDPKVGALEVSKRLGVI